SGRSPSTCAASPGSRVSSPPSGSSTPGCCPSSPATCSKWSSRRSRSRPHGGSQGVVESTAMKTTQLREYTIKPGQLDAFVVAWVGASFYFTALDQSLRPPKRDGAEAEGVGGEAWEIHGGGFYRVEKYRVAPRTLPAPLAWFKWEAYTTWLTGFALMVLLYYVDPSQYLMDPARPRFQGWELVVASLAILTFGWLAFDLLSR